MIDDIDKKNDLTEYISAFEIWFHFWDFSIISGMWKW